jgi:hypothetical protein
VLVPLRVTFAVLPPELSRRRSQKIPVGVQGVARDGGKGNGRLSREHPAGATGILARLRMANAVANLSSKRFESIGSVMSCRAARYVIHLGHEDSYRTITRAFGSGH